MIERLRERLELRERFRSILEITNAESRLKRADEIEAVLIEEMRRLGKASLGSWACGAEKSLGEEFQQKDASAVVRKKTLKWWCVFGAMSIPERVWRTAQKPYVRLLPEAIGVRPRGRSKRLERVLADFGCEHSFEQAAARVLEHYGFEINVSAVRESTLEHACQAEELLQKEYEQPFRALPAVGAEYVVTEADGSMVCTVAAGARKGKRPRHWKDTSHRSTSLGQYGNIFFSFFRRFSEGFSRANSAAPVPVYRRRLRG